LRVTVTLAAHNGRRDLGSEAMTERVWEQFLTEQDKAVFEQSGMGQRSGFGHRPALVVIDVNYNFTGDKPEPILESIKRWPLSCGEVSWPGITAISRLLDAARAKRIPVFYTTGELREDAADYGAWAGKNARMGEDRARFTKGNEIVDEIKPQASDFVIKKQKASAFHGTPLVHQLVDLQVDTLLFTGTTTSGCVRASVVDAASYNYRCAVVEEGCFDRSQASHALSLCDMHMKYSDVVGLDDALGYIEKLPKNLFHSNTINALDA